MHPALKRWAIAAPLIGLGGAGVSMLTSGEPYSSMYRPTPGGDPSLGMRYLSAYREGMRPMTQAAQGYGMGKFGGVKTANLVNSITNFAKTTGKNVGIPLVGGIAAMELLDPISDIFKPVATDAGERISAGLGFAETPWEQMAQKGLDSLAYHGAKELAAGASLGLGAGGRAGLGLMRRPASFESMMGGDPVLSQAPREQRPLLEQSYQAMQRVAPQLSQEPFVTKNFLRDIMVTNTGPDHATLSSLARSEQTIADARGGGR